MHLVEWSVATAAGQIRKAVSAAGWEPCRVVIAATGDDPLWESIGKVFEDDGIHAIRSATPVTPRSQLLRELADSWVPGDLIIVHDEARSGTVDEICDAVRALCATGALVMFVEFPAGVERADRLRAMYLEALSYPVDLIVEKMGRVGRSLRLGKAELRSGATTMTFNVDAVLDDFSVLDVGPQILQLPLGEVWVLASAAQGGIEVQVGRTGQIHALVEGGVVSHGGTSHGPVVEVGIGVNPSARVIPTSLCEKADGRIHVGLGDDDLIGGRRAGTWHGDVLTVEGTRLEWP